MELVDAREAGLRVAPSRASIQRLSSWSARTFSTRPGVADVHDLHAWTITSGMNVVSAYVVLDEAANPPAVLDHLCRCLSGDFDIEHSTFQLESADRRRLEEAHHA